MLIVQVLIAVGLVLIGQSPTLVVEEVLRVSDDTVFGEVTSMAFGEPGQLLVLDRLSREYVSIDLKTGETLFRAGGSGAGPGEFTMPSHIAANRLGNVAVLDVGAGFRMSTFAAGGEHQKTFQLPFRSLGQTQQVAVPGDQLLVLSLPMPQMLPGADLGITAEHPNLAITSDFDQYDPVWDWKDIGPRSREEV